LDYYIDNGFYWSFGFKSRFNAFNRNIDTDFKDGSLYEQLGIRTINYDFSDFTNQMYLQTIFVQKFLLGAGVEQKHLKVRSKTLGSSSPIFENSDYTSIFDTSSTIRLTIGISPDAVGISRAIFNRICFHRAMTSTSFL
jgi:NTE family protein